MRDDQGPDDIFCTDHFYGGYEFVRSGDKGTCRADDCTNPTIAQQRIDEGDDDSGDADE